MKVQANFRIKQTTLDYLKAIGKAEDRTVSYLLNKAIEYVVEKHQAAPTGDQASLEILRLLGSKPTEATKRSTDC